MDYSELVRKQDSVSQRLGVAMEEDADLLDVLVMLIHDVAETNGATSLTARVMSDDQLRRDIVDWLSI